MRHIQSFCLLVVIAAAGCGEDQNIGPTQDGGTDASNALAHTLYVAHEGSLVSYDIATGEERPGTVTNVTGPVDLQALENGLLLVDLTGRNEILVVDGATMLEEARLPSSQAEAVRPVHGYITPVHGGKRYWVVHNDGSMGMAETNSARFIDITEGSSTYLQPVGEVALGIGHHKAAFSATKERAVISNISDCDNVMTVYDYSDVANIQAVATLTAAAAGWDGSSYARTCDPTYQNGVPPAPHGCTTSPLSGKIYCNLTSSGEMVVVDVDADVPTFQILATEGTGGGYTQMHAQGRYAYTMLEEPRELYDEAGGTVERACRIGGLAVTDTMTDTVVTTLPLFYTGPSCTTQLSGTPAETANPGHTFFSPDGSTLFVTTSGGFGAADARVDQLVIVDTSDPAAPVQEASIQVGVHTGHGAGAISGTGKDLFVVHGVDGTVTHIDVATRAIVKTMAVAETPKAVATFGSTEGPSHQTGPIEGAAGQSGQ